MTSLRARMESGWILLLVAVLLAGACRGRGACGSGPMPCGPQVVTPPVPPSAPPDAAAEAAPEDPIVQVLESKRIKGLVWEEVNLQQALTYLTTITGVRFTISPEAREEQFDDMVINAQLDDVSVRNVLDVVLTAPWGLRWEVRDGVVHIMTKEEGGAAGRAEHDSLADPARPALDPAMRAKLEGVQVSLAVSDSTLADVVQMLQLQTGFNLMIDPRIVGEVGNAPITGMKLEGAPLLTAMDMLASAAGEQAVWSSQGNVVVLTRRELAR